MKKWTKFNKVMSVCVMISSIIIAIFLAICLFVSAIPYHNSILGKGTAALFIWSGIGMLIFGTIFSVGVFAVWNMLIGWYDPDSTKKAQQAPMYYAQPAQTANWLCPKCSAANNINHPFCINCGEPRQ